MKTETIHYVDNLSTKAVIIQNVRTATFTQEQKTLCGLTINVKLRNEFATKVQGIGAVDCEECKRIWTARMNRRFDCSNCGRDLQQPDILDLSPRDMVRLCLACKNGANTQRLMPITDFKMKEPDKEIVLIYFLMGVTVIVGMLAILGIILYRISE